MMNLFYKAKKLGATDFGKSKIKGKKYYIIYNNKIINFGSEEGSTFIDHFDKGIKNAWIARHSKIKNKDGQHVIKLKSSPSYWSKNILWN